MLRSQMQKFLGIFVVWMCFHQNGVKPRCSKEVSAIRFQEATCFAKSRKGVSTKYQQLTTQLFSGWRFQRFLNIFYFHHYLGKIPILIHIFQRG